MIRRFALSLTALVTTGLWSTWGIAKGGDGSAVGNGGGAGEMAVVYAYQNYAELTTPCLKTQHCSLTLEESSLLTEILGSLDQESPLKFTNAIPSLYQTEPEVGAEIHINKGGLWFTDLSGEKHAYTVWNGLDLLTRALAEHHPKHSEATARTLAHQVAEVMQAENKQYLPYLFSQNLRAVTFKGQSMDRMLLDDGNEVFFSLDALFKKELGCTPSRLWIFQFSWGGLVAPGSNPIETTLGGRISWQCQGSEIKHSASVTVSLKALPFQGTVEEFWQTMESKIYLAPQTEPEIILYDRK